MASDREKASAWLAALRHAELKWRGTDYRTPEYEEALREVLDLVRRDYIVNVETVIGGTA